MGGDASNGGDFEAVLTRDGRVLGWRGLFANRKCFGLAMFASLGGVLYGYNQGVFGQVQVMASFQARFPVVVSENEDTDSLFGSPSATLDSRPHVAFASSASGSLMADVLSSNPPTPPPKVSSPLSWN